MCVPNRQLPNDDSSSAKALLAVTVEKVVMRGPEIGDNKSNSCDIK